jgi:hypothetical protein
VAETPRYSLLAVSHSGLLRVFLSRLIGSARLAAHPDAIYKEETTDGQVRRRFVIPNTSLTVLDLKIQIQDLLRRQEGSDDSADAENGSNGTVEPSGLSDLPVEIEIVQLTSTDHLVDVALPEKARELQETIPNR